MTEYDSDIELDNNEDSDNSDNESINDVDEVDVDEVNDVNANVDDDDDGSVMSDADQDDVSDIENDGEGEGNGDKAKIVVEAKKKKPVIINYDDDDEDSDDDDVNYLQKFDLDVNTNYVSDYHPECQVPNFDEISKLALVVRDDYNTIIDPLHRTIPYLTKYERARILGQRAKQIESGSEPFINIPESVIDGHIIAELELQQKRIPFIIRRPIPDGSFEYWHVRDLENIAF
jgi:DNA-directed RNA polymerase I, II, and III subunit RPABC2